MGLSRRMQKQGPPQAPEQLNSAIKRKAGEQSRSNVSTSKRRKSGQIEHTPSRSFKSDDKKRSRAKKGLNVLAHAKESNVNGKSQAAKDVRKKAQADSEILGDLEDESASESLPSEFEVVDGGDNSENDDVELDQMSDDSVVDSDTEPARNDRFSEEEDDSDAEEKLTAANIEGLSRRLDEDQQAIEAEAQNELEDAAMQTNIMGTGDGQDSLDPASAGLAPNLQLLRTRITDTIRVLGDFAKLADKEKSRSDYISLLQSDISTYYGYTPYLAEKLLSLFSPSEAFAFFEANESPRPVVLRTNTIRTNRRTLAQSLINRGVVLEPVGKWSKVGLQVFESAVPLGATPEYLAGHYIIQAASSFLPVMALAPQPNERILDMAAAPGGKTTHISALMRNTGSVFANDANRQRAKGLIGNVHRLGCKNTIVCQLDAKNSFPKVLGGFDRVLLDAPCSGTGVIGKDASVKTSKTERDFLALPHSQKQLLLAAVDSTNHASKTGGIIVYSTCSVTVEENEGVVDYVLRKRPNVRIIDSELGTFGSPGFKKYMNKRFDERMDMARRYFPHRENVDGFFVCKLQKVGPNIVTHQSQVDASGSTGSTANEVVPKMDTNQIAEMSLTTPISDWDHVTEAVDDFGSFDDEADAVYIANAERKRLRRKGLNPRTASQPRPARVHAAA